MVFEKMILYKEIQDDSMRSIKPQLLVAVVEIVLICAIRGKLIAGEATSLTRRPKRLMWSRPLLDSQSPFRSPHFYAYITIGSTWSRFRLELYRKYYLKFLGEGTAHPDSHWCGGSMLTPRAVGTACHCISHSQRLNGSYSRRIARDGWEDFYGVFNGYFTQQDMEANPIGGSWAWSRKYVIHEKCAKIHAEPEHEGGLLVHDFGLILLSKAMTFPKPGSGSVPPYTVGDIARMFNYMNQREPICLAVGYGTYNFVEPGITGPHSPVMMHGWQNVRNYLYCINIWGLHYGETIPQWFDGLGYNYYSMSSSVCATFFGKIRNQVMKGDSGGPLTCDNMYVGLFQQGTKLDFLPRATAEEENSRTREYDNLAAAIAYALEWHSAEYRTNLDDNLELLAKSSAKEDTLTQKPKLYFNLVQNDASTFTNGATKSHFSLINTILCILLLEKIIRNGFRTAKKRPPF